MREKILNEIRKLKKKVETEVEIEEVSLKGHIYLPPSSPPDPSIIKMTTFIGLARQKSIIQGYSQMIRLQRRLWIRCL